MLTVVCGPNFTPQPTVAPLSVYHAFAVYGPVHQEILFGQLPVFVAMPENPLFA